MMNAIVADQLSTRPIARLFRPRWGLRAFLVACGLSGIVAGWVGRQIELARLAPISLLAPIAEGSTVKPVAAPSGAEILRVAAPVLPIGFRPTSVSCRRIEEYADSPRDYPLVGNASQIHRIYRCLVIGDFNGRPQTRVLYIDQNNLHAWR